MPWNCRIIFPLIACALAVLAAGRTSVVAQAGPESQVVVLANLNVLRGAVTLTERGLKLETTSGSTIELAHAQIWALAESVDEAYPQIARKLNLSNDADLQQLLQWCLQNHLVERAEALVAWAGTESRTPALLDGMQRQITQYRTQSAAASPAPASAHSLPGNVGPREPQAAAAWEKQIDTALAQLPKNAERYFNRELQPKLIAGCAAANCHHAQRSGLALWHDGSGHVGIRGYSRRNLFQVLQWIDVERPAESPLLARARTAHGEPASTAWGADSAEYQLLEYWTYALSRDPARYYEEVVLPSIAAQLQENPPMPPDESSSERAPEIATVGFDEVPSPVPPEKLIEAGPEPLPATLVPCDPLPFNRKYHPGRSGK